MTIESSMVEDTQVVTVTVPRIDAAIAISFKDAMREETANGTERVILDLTQVEFIDSSGLGAIVAAMKQLGPKRRLDLAGLSKNVDTVFRLTRMDTVFRLFPTLNDAVASDAA